MAGKEDNACVRHELLWVYSVFLPAQSLLLTSPALSMALPCRSQPTLLKEADDPKQKG